MKPKPSPVQLAPPQSPGSSDLCIRNPLVPVCIDLNLPSLP